jgi:pyruvate dehydrogenase E2 component (dihydrolipoamide acetyltransferase)
MAPAAAAATPAESAAGVTVKDLTRIQLTTGRRLSESKQQAPHFYLTVEVDMAEALKLRATLNEKAGGAFKISVNDLVIKAATWALTRHPGLNASFQNGRLLLYERVHIAVAVAIDEGLVSPVLFDADRKSLGQIARESRALVERARTGKLRPDDLSGGTFTVSNLGMYDMDNFVAIINPPQAAILAVGAVREIPVVREGQIVIGQVMKATLSVDHRAADGAQGAQFLADVRNALESPLLMAL